MRLLKPSEINFATVPLQDNIQIADGENDRRAAEIRHTAKQELMEASEEQNDVRHCELIEEGALDVGQLG